MRTHAHDTFTTILQPALASSQGLAHHWLRDPNDAEDAIQETALRMLRFADSFDPETGSAEAWVTTILRRECARIANQRCRRIERYVAVDYIDELARATWEPETSIDDQRELVALEQAIRDLPPLFRSAIEMQISGLSCEDSAAEAGVPTNTIHGRRSRARQGISRRMKRAA